MKKLSLVLYTLLFFVVGNASFAKKKQKTELKKQKAELKAWKKRKAAIKPLQLKELVEENHRLKSQNQELLVESKLVKDAIDAGRGGRGGRGAARRGGREGQGRE